MAHPQPCICPACRPAPRHASDCAVHNAPAYPSGPCDCGALGPDPEGRGPTWDMGVGPS